MLELGQSRSLMAQNGINWQPNGDEALILALAAGGTVKAAAAKVRMAERTAHRRMADPGFRERVIEPRGRMFDQSLGRLAGVTAKAIARLDELLCAKKETVALGAARAILEHAKGGRDAVELSERITKVESALSEKSESQKDGCVASAN
jgi:hypothetical protein